MFCLSFLGACAFHSVTLFQEEKRGSLPSAFQRGRSHDWKSVSWTLDVKGKAERLWDEELTRLCHKALLGGILSAPLQVQQESLCV